MFRIEIEMKIVSICKILSSLIHLVDDLDKIRIRSWRGAS